MDVPLPADYEAVFRRLGVVSGAQIAQALGTSQPTVSRTLGRAGEAIVRIGRARAARYALARDIGRAGSHWPLYRLDAAAKAHRIGELHALHAGGFFFDPARQEPALLHGEFASGLFPALPWFLDDQRPQGFLGRAFARKFAAELEAPADVSHWRSDDVVLALLRHGDDNPGDLVLGEHSLQRALSNLIAPAEVLPIDRRLQRYPELAANALRGDPTGSSAGGEQPKFAITLEHPAGHTPVIVKFSERLSTAIGRRWGDLLICEQIAATTLRENGQRAADNEILEVDGRIFLQSTRFDRTPVLGRRGVVSLAALDAAHYGNGAIEWWRFADRLQRDGWLSAADATALRRVGWFGALIDNTDMHLGNVSLHLIDRRPLPLAPAYDMLPMALRPAAHGELVERDYAPVLPAPEFQDDWQVAAPIAAAFWQRVAGDARVSPAFRQVAERCATRLQQTMARL
jgi:hypothetical protein